MHTRNIKLTNMSDFTKGGSVFCTDFSPEWEYVDGKPTNVRRGTKYEVVFPDNGFEKAIIKTPEQRPTFTMEDITYNGNKIEVIVDGFEASVYVNRNGRAEFSLKAKSVKLAPQYKSAER